MKQLKSIIAIMAATALTALPAKAQDYGHKFPSLRNDTIESLRHYRFTDNWYVGLHLGVNGSMSENIRPKDWLHTQTFTGYLSLGKFFVPTFGLRLTAGFYRQESKVEPDMYDYVKSRWPDQFNHFGKGYYKFKNFNGWADAMINLSNTFYRYREDRRWNVLGFVGIGYNNTYGYDTSVTDFWAAPNPDDPGSPSRYVIDTKARWYLAVRAGFIVSYMLNDQLDIDLDMHIDATDDGYNGVRYDDLYDGYTVFALGMKYHLPDHYGDRRFRYARVTDLPDVELANRRINDARRELDDASDSRKPDVEAEQYLEMTVSFVVDRYNITEVQRPNVEAVANYMEAHPDINVTICGFADVETAYPAHNMKLSNRRATAVYRMLTKQFGVDPRRLSIDYRGDIVQPYRLQNEWNRVVVFKINPNNDYKFLEEK
jgi:hypothetical protein